MIPVDVMGVSVCSPYQGYVVILREREGKRWLPIFIGAAEAQAISLLLQEVNYSRPLTFDLLYSLMEAADTEVKRVNVTELKDNTFYALTELRTPKGEVSIDSRPSDAIALALRFKAPIFVATEVMDTASVSDDRAQGQLSNLDLISELNRQLQAAIESESYEEAAKIRDRIRELEKKEDLR